MLIIMGMLRSLWNWLNGKKTTLGALVWFAASQLSQAQATFGFQWVDQSILDQIMKYAQDWLGLSLLHKGAKKVNLMK